MKKLVFALSVIIIAMSCKDESRSAQEEFHYPLTKKVDTVDTYFDTAVADPYRWLEDEDAEATKSWVTAQNNITNKFLNQIPFRDEWRKRLENLWNYEKTSRPRKEGKYVYYYKNDGLQNQYVVYRKDENGNEAVFLDPNKFSEDGTTSLSSLRFTEDGSLAAYMISEGGSDWRKCIVIDAENREMIGDTLVNVKFSGISWKGNHGFYYSSYDKPKGSELTEKTDQHKLYYHKLGTDQKDDIVVYGAKPSEKHRYVSGQVTEDETYLFIYASKSTSGNQVFVKDLKNPNSPLKPIHDNYESDTYLLHNEGSKLWLVTNHEAPNKKIVLADAKNPRPKNWKEFIPETENVLTAGIAGDYIFTEYMVDAISKVLQYDHSGKLIREVPLPGVGSVYGFNGKKEDTKIYFTFGNYITPWSLYEYELSSGAVKSFWAPEIDFNSSEYESKQVFYNSKDGTKVPMIISYKKGLELNGKNPTILYGYGGFDVSLNPYFSISKSVWMEQGGIYAVANLRGGGEYGKKWHLAGTKMNKQNVFDDFIAAGEYLINEKYTSREYLAIQGGSNGGLLVGATMTQRPDLAKVALPSVGVLDMLRYHTFTAGAGWAYDYGTSEESKEMFDYLKGYSPLHNIEPQTSYPATLVTTADHDDRVVPAHSFKFAATLQENHVGPNPVMIRIETKAGHGAGKPTSKIIDEQIDIMSFALYNMGFDKLPDVSVLKPFKD